MRGDDMLFMFLSPALVIFDCFLFLTDVYDYTLLNLRFFHIGGLSCLAHISRALCLLL